MGGLKDTLCPTETQLIILKCNGLNNFFSGCGHYMSLVEDFVFDPIFNIKFRENLSKPT